jgi:hypothetical protein
MSCHNKDRSCFQAASLGTLCLSDRLNSFDMVNKVVDMVNKVVDMVNKVVDMVNKVVDMVNKVVDMAALVDHDNELWVVAVDVGNSVGIHIEKDID